MKILHVLLMILVTIQVLCYVLGVLFNRFLCVIIVLPVVGNLLWVMTWIFVQLCLILLPGVMMTMTTVI